MDSTNRQANLAESTSLSDQLNKLGSTAGPKELSDPNRLGLDFKQESKFFPVFEGGIIDVHNHIRNIEAAHTTVKVADDYGIAKLWSMTQLEDIDPILDVYPDRFEFIAIPNYYQGKEDPSYFQAKWLKQIEVFAEKGIRICKFWAAPRSRDFAPDLVLGSEWQRKAIEVAHDCGMMFMVHISDPDTWFATHYSDSTKYGTKMDQYLPLVQQLEEYSDTPWIAAHMAGHPEDLGHLSELLDNHPNLHLDTSATKWMVRELSKHASDLEAFFEKHPGRILFGSDIVAEADSSYELLASRYWALRTLFESGYDGKSPIVDPDLHRVNPEVDEKSTAQLRGAGFKRENLVKLYQDSPVAFWEKWPYK